jgi:hypothetical protein
MRSLLLRDRYDKILRPSFIKWIIKRNPLGKNWSGSKLLLSFHEWRPEDFIVSILPYTKSSGPIHKRPAIPRKFHQDLSASSDERERNFCDGILYKGKSRIFYPHRGLILRPLSRVSQIWPLGYCSGTVAEGLYVRPSARWSEDRPSLRVEYPGNSLYEIQKCR